MFVRRHSSYPAVALPGGCARDSNAGVYDGERIMTADLTSTGELKLGVTPQDIVNNEEKTLGHAGHAFWNDVGRVAVLSFTMEGSLMRLWHHTRSHTVASALFDIHNERLWFVEFILLNTYAPLSMLGIDPTVRRVIDDEAHLQYQFDIYAEDGSYKTYQTESVLEDVDDQPIYTRSMRVYKVHLVTHNADNPKERVLDKTPNVLRDYWVFSDVKDEGVIQEGIRRKLEPFPDWPQIKDHFMGIEEDGAVRYPPGDPTARSSVPPPPSDSLYFHFMNKDNPSNTPAAEAKIKSASATRDWEKKRDGVAKLAPEAASDPVLQVHGKKHCRTKYVQFCMDLYKVSHPALYFFALSQVVKILRYLKRAGYLHRDVSPGNFLLYHRSGTLPTEIVAELDQWITLVSDLEYSRPYHGGTGHDPLTGTSNFIAIEVQRHEHIFAPLALGTFPPISTFFAFNYYHDCESALWMALDFAFRKISKSKLGTSVSGDLAEEILRGHAVDLFPRTESGSAARHGLLTNNGKITRLDAALCAVYGLDTPLRKIIALIPKMRDAYENLEDSVHVPTIKLDEDRQVLDDSLFLDDIYDKMEATFREISDAFLNCDEEFVWLPPPPVKVIPPPRFASEARMLGPEVPPVIDSEETTQEDNGSDADADGPFSRPETPTPGPRTRSRARQAKASANSSRDTSTDTQRGARKRDTRETGTERKPPRKRSRPSPEPKRRSGRLAAKSKEAPPPDGPVASRTRSGGRSKSPKDSGSRQRKRSGRP
ncbi:hypothetical protein EV714DRAFT_206401 [Schizophyllum commune]